MTTDPDDIEALKAALVAERAARQLAEARMSSAEAMVAHLKLTIAKYKRDRFGQSSERARHLGQLEFQLEELEATATEDALAAEAAAVKAGSIPVKSFERKKPVRAPLPAHLPRERVVIPVPCSCPSCGGKLAKLGEDTTETLEVIPRQWKVIQTVREKFSCRACEAITQPPAPFHPIARGRAGAGLLAMVLHGKFGNHLPLNRQSESFAREGIDLDVSTLADWVGACTATLAPLVDLIRAHVLGAARLHGDDTTVPVLAKMKTRTGRLWTYVRDDRPFGGPSPPAAIFYYSSDREGVQASRDLEVDSTVLRRWVNEFGSDAQQAFPGHGQQKADQAEIARLRHEVAKLKAERDILKKPRPTSRRTICGVRHHREAPGDIADGMDVRRARCLAWWVLWLPKTLRAGVPGSESLAQSANYYDPSHSAANS